MDVGVEIGEYQIVEHIGRGGMADVWSARDMGLGRTVAVKTIAKNLSIENDPVALFEQEARTIASLDHPNILPIYRYGKYEDRLYIVMRFVTGGSLEETIRGGRMSYATIMRVARAVGSALKYAHDNKVIHLDLKPPNILMDSQGHPYLADFGLATMLGPEGRARNPGSGTLLYMAPEQLTSDELDNRADIYAFSLILFHMLTGQLPFEAMMPLALKQIQLQENLPFLDDVNPDIPTEVTNVLRKGTALDPDTRYGDVMTLIEDVEAALGPELTGVPVASGGDSGRTRTFADLATTFDPEQAQIAEAIDLYQRAQLAWAGGQGRFLLGVTHFMVMSDYYMHAAQNGLEYDEAGLQMLLRGALEYDHEIPHWWAQLDDRNRRWVCLHAIRSENSPTRVRALRRLETLPDADPPQIPRQVAQSIQIDEDDDTRLAALRVLSTRAALQFGRQEFDLKTDFRGRMLDTGEQADLMRTTKGWQQLAFSRDVDLLVAEEALVTDAPKISEMAARTIGNMRSIAAVQYLRMMGQDSGNRFHELRALAFVLDEAGSLPRDVSVAVRLGAWGLNSWRRLSQRPMLHVWAFLFAMLGGWLGMGQTVYRLFRSEAIFNQQRIGNTLGIGIFFGFFAGLTAVLSYRLPARLREFWPKWAQLLWSGISAFFMTQFLWWSYRWMFLQDPQVPQDILILMGVATSIGYVVPTLYKLRGWQSFLFSLVPTFAAFWLAITNLFRLYIWDQPKFNIFGLSLTDVSYIITLDEYRQLWTVVLPFVILMSIGIHLQEIVHDIRGLVAWVARRGKPMPVAPRSVAAGDMVDAGGPRTAPQRMLETGEIESLDMAQAIASVKVTEDKPDWESITASLGSQQTEEFEVDRVGEQAEADAAPDWDAITGALGGMTEEFEVGQVGGHGEADEADAAPDWDAITGALGGMTEEFEVDRVGGHDEADEADDDIQIGQMSTGSGIKPNLVENMPVDLSDDASNPMTEEFEVGQIGGRVSSDEGSSSYDDIAAQLDALGVPAPDDVPDPLKPTTQSPVDSSTGPTPLEPKTEDIQIGFTHTKRLSTQDNVLEDSEEDDTPESS